MCQGQTDVTWSDMEGDFRHVCENDEEKQRCFNWRVLGVSESMCVFMLSFMMFLAIQAYSTTIYLDLAPAVVSKRVSHSGAAALFCRVRKSR